MSGVPGLIRALLSSSAQPGGGQPLEAAQLRALLDVGDVLTVKVLAQVVGRPTIEIAGRPVLAALPEGVAPGDLLQVRVEGFTPDQVLLKLLAHVPAQPSSPQRSAPLPAADPRIPGEPAHPAAVPLPQAGSAPPAARSPQTDGPPPANDLPARLAAFRLSTAAGALAEPRRAAPPLPAAPSPLEEAPAASVPSPAQPAPPVAPPPAVARAVTQAPPGAALLRMLRIPVTPTTLAAARIALSGSARVASALEVLQQALPLGSEDPRVRYVRTIAEFVGTLDPGKPDVLPARIDAYVQHVLGGEARLRQALVPEQAAPGAETPSRPAPSAAPGTAAASTPGVPQEVGQARAVVAREAVAANLKTAVMELMAGPQGADPATRAALQGALTAITATQVQTLSLQASTPQMLAIPLPLPFPQGGQQAYLRVARDARNPAAPVSPESFHLALVLETKHHGTVAIELLCADRALSVDVKAERASAAAAFEQRLPELASRLERLSYRVVRLDAGVAPQAAAPAPAPGAPAADQRDDGSALDLRA
ncbi:MAG TPA: flagellar hook-length control protein FliK [Candidatus Dormibacteraeota bacterium]|nr:flagellar hook-length control protein FliK [Candidatus Dormibacteraeota bacterium]